MADTAPLYDPAAPTRYIEKNYHAQHRERLPLLAHMAEQVETVHFDDDHVPEGLSDLLVKMKCSFRNLNLSKRN